MSQKKSDLTQILDHEQSAQNRNASDRSRPKYNNNKNALNQQYLLHITDYKFYHINQVSPFILKASIKHTILGDHIIKYGTKMAYRSDLRIRNTEIKPKTHFASQTKTFKKKKKKKKKLSVIQYSSIENCKTHQTFPFSFNSFKTTNTKKKKKHNNYPAPTFLSLPSLCQTLRSTRICSFTVSNPQLDLF